MFGSTFASTHPQPQPQPPQVNLREADTLTELCHVAEAVVPHPLNKEYRLKHVFVDVGGKTRHPKDVPVLGAHEYIHAANQAQRFGLSVENCVPTVAVGFAGLKARFDSQQAAITLQEQTIKGVKQRIARENNAYRKNCTERLRKWYDQTRTTETQLLNLFRKVEESRMRLATTQGKRYSVKSSLRKVMDEVQTIQRTFRDESVKTRVVSVEKNMYLARPIAATESIEQDPETVEKKTMLLRQSKEMIHGTKRVLETCERDVKVMKPNKDASPNSSHHPSS